MLKQWYTETINYLKKWKIYVGVDMRTAPQYSIVFFPLLANVICCGFAGILTIKGSDKAEQTDLIEKFTRLFREIKKKEMKAILSGAATPVHYLGGNGYLEGMEETLLQLKKDVSFQHIFFNSLKTAQLSDLTQKMKAFFAEEEKCLEENAGNFSTGDMETINSRHILMKDIIWSLEKDVHDNFGRIVSLAGAGGVDEISPESFIKYKKINFLLNCLDRLEVRGRDSAGIQISFTFRDSTAFEEVLKVLKEKGLYDDFARRTRPCDLFNGSICLSSETPSMKKMQSDGIALSFVYKTSSIIGELGQNVRDLRKFISQDQIFLEFSRQKTKFETFISHTRWASVGSITDDNCHPVNNFTPGETIPSQGAASPEVTKNYPHYGEGNWFISVVLNGDIDNYQSLRNDLEGGKDLIAPHITTDTKIIPLQIEKYLLRGHDVTESFRLAVNDFEGSHAIAMVSNAVPGKIFLALKGSGQSIYVGIAPDQYIFSSELYGLVEGTPFFLKMDGEKPSTPDAPETSGQIFILDQDSHGGVSGINSLFYDGTALSIGADSVQKAEITTRDIDRGENPHYFLKEISESMLSVRKTLRGKYRIVKKENGRYSVIFNLGQDIIPEKFRHALARGEIRNIIVIGHGTAAVAGEAVTDSLLRYLKGTHIKIEAKVASELSGFFLEDDLKDTLVIPITQSGTTTDTNRAVAMAVERGATVIAIVNRRQSDITSKANGVFYTSDGRDIEMSVASTKAFYSQVIAGHVLALCIAQLLKNVSDDFIAEELLNLEQAPNMMSRVIEKKAQIRQSVEILAKQRRYWAVVGSGPNKAAADEIRIKLSELCYKTISSDFIENKKHIDLSAEPLIIVCAAGSPETVTGDIIKDVAIFKAHRAGVVVFADEGEDRFNSVADAVIEVPRAPMPMPVILNTLAGHLWGYYAACSINEDAAFLREFRSQLNQIMAEHEKKNYSIYERIADRNYRGMVRDFSSEFNQKRGDGAFSFTNVNTISDIVLLLKYAAGKLPLEDYWRDFKREEGLSSPIELLDISIGHSIDELSRPIDAIRHQAKTVTVGTSRKEQPVRGIIFNLLRELEFTMKALVSKNALTITRIQPAIAAIHGYTLYDISNLDVEGNPVDISTITIKKRGGISLTMKSRAENSHILMGTKRTIVSTGHIYVGRGKSDSASIVVLPLLGDRGGVQNLLLIHSEFNEALSVKEKKEVLGYQYNDIRNMVNEYNLPWDDRYLETISTGVLLGEPAEVIAGQIRKSVEEGSGI
ncbi:MAG: SIS domain-containing protein [Deltaproteobacteria bacterium]|nr:SIS domain-containing protein [Deltaproteobacteria bacterium]